MNDGRRTMSKDDANICAQLPRNIRVIDVTFHENDYVILSLTFLGDSTLTIGSVDTDWKGRVESFTVPKEKALLGFEIFRSVESENFFKGLKFLTWDQPLLNPQLATVPELTE